MTAVDQEAAGSADRQATSDATAAHPRAGRRLREHRMATDGCPEAHPPGAAACRQGD